MGPFPSTAFAFISQSPSIFANPGHHSPHHRCTLLHSSAQKPIQSSAMADKNLAVFAWASWFQDEKRVQKCSDGKRGYWRFGSIDIFGADEARYQRVVGGRRVVIGSWCSGWPYGGIETGSGSASKQHINQRNIHENIVARRLKHIASW